IETKGTRPSAVRDGRGTCAVPLRSQARQGRCRGMRTPVVHHRTPCSELHQERGPAMTASGLTAGQAGREDHAAAEELRAYELNRLPFVRNRAEKWVAALPAFTGLLTTVL